MSIVNVSLPDPLMVFVDEQVKRGGFDSTADYVRQLIRDQQQRLAADRLRELIAEGLASGPVVAVTKEYWAAKRKQLIANDSTR
jgi:antitoxin ParD1/3/4